MKNTLTSLKLAGLTLLVCCVAYPLMVLALAQAIDQEKAEGSLLRNEAGEVIGSRLIAQEFTSPQYFWTRPSAAEFDGKGAGGSNLSPNHPDLSERALKILQRLNLPEGQLAPADLITASGSGLDPHISETAARVQVSRVAAARNLSALAIERFIEQLAFAPGGRLAPARIVNVLELNVAIQRELPAVLP
jgi:potassium-transporting ATPase KdpC subunit